MIPISGSFRGEPPGPEDPRVSNNKNSMRSYYRSKDPARVKNVDALFLRYEEADILRAFRDKYHAVPAGWEMEGEGHEEEEKPKSMMGKIANRLSIAKSSSPKDGLEHMSNTGQVRNMSKRNAGSNDGSGVITPPSGSRPASNVAISKNLDSSSDEEGDAEAVRIPDEASRAVEAPTPVEEAAKPVAPNPAEPAPTPVETPKSAEPKLTETAAEISLPAPRKSSVRRPDEPRPGQASVTAPQSAEASAARKPSIRPEAPTPLEASAARKPSIRPEAPTPLEASAARKPSIRPEEPTPLEASRPPSPPEEPKPAEQAPEPPTPSTDPIKPPSIEQAVTESPKAPPRDKTTEGLAKLKKAEEEQAQLVAQLRKADEERAAAVAALQRAAEERRAMAADLGLETDEFEPVGALIMPTQEGQSGPARVTLYERKLAAIHAGQVRVVEESIMVPGRQSMMGRITGRQPKPEVKQVVKLEVVAPIVEEEKEEVIDGYRKPPRDSPDLVKYHKMSKAGLPQGAVELSMIRDGFHPSAVFDDPMNKPKPAAPVAKPAAKPAPAAAAPAIVAAASADETAVNGYRKPPRDSPDLVKYHKMGKAGLPQGAVELAMIRDGFHPSALFDDPMNNPGAAPKKPEAKPAAVPAASDSSKQFKRPARDSPELAKFLKMSSAGLPQGAVENAMIREGIHPAALFDSPINDPDRLPVSKKQPEAKPIAAAAPAAAAAPIDASIMPKGLSLMEEMKWKAAHKPAAKPFVEPVKAAPPPPAEPARPLGVGPMPAGLSMMEEMKWKQAAKALKGDALPVEVPKKAAAPPSAAPTVALKPAAAGSSKPSMPVPAANKPLAPASSINKPLAPASSSASSNNKPSAPISKPPEPNKAVEAIVALLVGAKIAPDNAKKYAAALAKEGFDAPDKLPLLDEADLVACGVTTRFDIKIILQLKSTVTLAPAVVQAAAAAPKPVVPVAKPATSVPTPAKPGVAAAPTPAKPGVAAAPTPAKPGVAATPTKPSAAAPSVEEKKASPFGPSVGSADKRAQQDKEKAERLAMALALTQPVKPIEKKPPGMR